MKRRRVLVIGIAVVLLGAAALLLFLRFRSTQQGLALLRFLPPQADLYGMADLEGLQTNPGVRRFLTGPPAGLLRAGWNRETIKPGDQVTMVSHPHKEGIHRVRFEKLVVNGKTLRDNNQPQ